MGPVADYRGTRGQFGGLRSEWGRRVSIANRDQGANLCGCMC